VLGSFKVGNHAKIGANSVVLHEVPPNSTVVGIPGRIVKQNGYHVQRTDLSNKLDHGNLSDPIMDMNRQLQKQIDELKQKLEQVKQEQGLQIREAEHRQVQHRELEAVSEMKKSGGSTNE
jgi:serine O-acetyltransferase